jgi:hypothetical protein
VTLSCLTVCSAKGQLPWITFCLKSFTIVGSNCVFDSNSRAFADSCRPRSVIRWSISLTWCVCSSGFCRFEFVSIGICSVLMRLSEEFALGDGSRLRGGKGAGGEASVNGTISEKYSQFMHSSLRSSDLRSDLRSISQE